MNKILNVTALIVFKIDTALYKTFGIVSTLRKQSWRRQGKRLQRILDRQHHKRDLYNSLFGHNYTTKRALELHSQDEVDLMEW